MNHHTKPKPDFKLDKDAFIMKEYKDFIQHNINTTSNAKLPSLVFEETKNHSPSERKYETFDENQKRLEFNKIQRLQHFAKYNPYDLKNYRVDNVKLPFSLPGEKFLINKKMQVDK